MNYLVMVLLMLTSILLILLVLIQRGRGGGLAGAFGGLGGQSAFGTKAGDLFTRITIGVAAFWIILCAASVKLLNEGSRSIIDPGLGGASTKANERPGTAPAKSDGGGTSSPPAGSTAPSGATGSSSAPAGGGAPQNK